ncbi:hypothetical protein [Methylobacter sp. S3L5C]|uniref:hypothetical protein n=1 Tax=Methylobacter sp. S3L5C TaxID=2839024 RepID=UPI001FAE4271|nr:hypothetical protein [Methylobacter sp. S3L5C]UOA08352.1 hypothetical protein KKZ03_19450 [Methylobacter sp. S3L5C]
MNLIMKDHNKKPGSCTKNVDLLSQDDRYIKNGKNAAIALIIALLVSTFFMITNMAYADNELHNLVSAELISYMSDNPSQKITLYDVE